MARKADQLHDTINEQIKTILDAAHTARQSDQFKAWLQFAARFHRYSFGNCILIAVQRPSATRVAGYRRWQKLGRQVRRGEKGISIIAPAPIYEERTDEETGETHRVQVALRFTGATVFDVSQTDGDPLPEPPDWKGNGRAPEVEHALLDYAHALDIKTTEYTGTQGPLGTYAAGHLTYSTDRGNVPRTIAHELTHALTADDVDKLDRDTNEAITDLAAAIVCLHFGIDAAESTANYIAQYSEKPKTLLDLAERARRTANTIITEVEARLEERS